MALTEEQQQHFYREGYVVALSLVSPEAVARVREAGSFLAGQSGGWKARSFNHRDPMEDAAVHQLLVEESVVDAARSLFANEPRILYGMLAVVPAHGGTGLPWHQDNQYTQVLGGALNVFVALCDITPDKAILWVAPQSHRWGTQPSKETAQENTQGHREAVVEPENGIPLPTLRAGDVCLFDRNTYHRSLKNETDEDRYAYAAQYQAENARNASNGRIDDDQIPNRLRATELRALWKARGLGR